MGGRPGPRSHPIHSRSPLRARAADLAYRGVCVALLGIALLGAIAATSATASQLIDRNAKNIQLATNQNGEALITYTADGKLNHVLAWGALNAIAPTRSRPQVKLKLDYSGGYGKYRRDWKTFGNVCQTYDGPTLAWPVAACRSTDGSYWALQSWQRDLPDVGLAPSPAQAAWELRLSHWTGAIPVLNIETDWAYRRYDHLFGTLTYNEAPQYGFRSTASGQPLDSYGRNIYLDTFDSAYGAGWKRENSFLTHTNTGAFCYGFFAHQNGSERPAGNGTKYRATVEGPGVTPDAMWQGLPAGIYDKDSDAQANDRIRALGDLQCKPN